MVSFRHVELYEFVSFRAIKLSKLSTESASFYRLSIPLQLRLDTEFQCYGINLILFPECITDPKFDVFDFELLITSKFLS